MDFADFRCFADLGDGRGESSSFWYFLCTSFTSSFVDVGFAILSAALNSCNKNESAYFFEKMMQQNFAFNALFRSLGENKITAFTPIQGEISENKLMKTFQVN